MDKLCCSLSSPGARVYERCHADSRSWLLVQIWGQRYIGRIARVFNIFLPDNVSCLYDHDMRKARSPARSLCCHAGSDIHLVFEVISKYSDLQTQDEFLDPEGSIPNDNDTKFGLRVYGLGLGFRVSDLGYLFVEA